MRIVPEWKEYDYEIKVLWDKVYGTNTRLQTEYEVSDTQKGMGQLNNISLVEPCFPQYSYLMLKAWP